MVLHPFWRAAIGGTMGLVLGATPSSLWGGEPVSAAKRMRKDEAKPAPSLAASGFRARTNSALSTPFPVASTQRRTQAENLVSLYKQIGDAKEITAAERSRLQSRIKSRLARLADAIALDVKQARAADQSKIGNRSSTGTDTSSKETPPASSAGSNGGGPQDDGQTLVELIRATIAPQSWDVNGGPGSIVYWPAWHVLVVRQTDDVHEQIGGAMHAMRK